MSASSSIGGRLERIQQDVTVIRVDVAGIKERMSDVEENQTGERAAREQLGERVTRLERWRYTVVGFGAAAGIVVNSAVTHWLGAR